MIRNLPHHTKIIDISIKAVNSAGLVGEETSLLDHRMTLEGSAFKKYTFELRRVESLKTEYVDTDFYNVRAYRYCFFVYSTYLHIYACIDCYSGIII